MRDDGAAPPYPEVESSPSFPAIETEILAYWEQERIFERSVEERPAKVDGASNEFVFYDGPPFANGLPHYGHLVTGFVKDIVPRYRTMRGRRVERRFGWDCHGLPAELTSEKELGISGRQEILKYGIAEFNAHCRVSVMRFTEEWRDYVTREGRWVDFENDYKTMNLSFMESVIWGFKQLYDKGWVYEGYRVVPYSWAVQTPLSISETRLDNSYRERQDPALTVGFLLEPAAGETVPTRLLAWTTTPWTLPSNLALAVGPELDYAIVEKDGERLILGAAALERYAKELGDWTQVATVKGSELAGRRYEPLFPYFKDTPNAFVVLAADFVEVTEGTGCVHIAPGFGEDDLDLARAHDIPLVVPVDEAGNFTAEVPDYQGLNVIEANKDVIRDLKARGVVLRHETYLHNYPHCWRTDTPLIYKAIHAWYVTVTAFRDRMVELNKEIVWTPAHVRDGLFGNWLENARDWNVSRNRFWGCPIPVWKSDDPRYPRIDVYGSLDEIERDFGVRPTDLHRPMIDELTRPNPDDPTGKSTMRRVTEVLDVWFDSGSMPFAQLHYPFENKERFEANFPADFIVEYVAQTRGWFYTLMVLSTALFDRAPFRNCVCHGVVLDENKQKLSKRLKNYPDPTEVFETYGADALRWYMVSSPLMHGGDLAMPQDGRGIAQALRQAIIPIWNAYYFFTLYANIDGYRARERADQTGVLDRYVLAKTRELVEQLQDRLEVNDLPGAYAVVPGYIDALNNWYIRRSRGRFWREEATGSAGGDGADKRDAYDTLHTVLTTFCRAMAPLLPFLTERIYRNLTGADSVHLADWPDAEALPAERALVAEMDRVREICAAVMALREGKSLRTRLPLKRLTVAHPEAARLEPYRSVIAEEVNVKEVAFSADPAAMGRQELKVNPQIGRRIGGKMKEVMAASRSGDWSPAAGGKVAIAGIELDPEDYTLRVVAGEGLDSEGFDGGDGIVVLDTRVYEELKREGWARDFVRLVQQTRKEAGLAVTDRIRLAAELPEEVAAAIAEHGEHVCRETLAVELRLNQGPLAGFTMPHKLEGKGVQVSVEKTAA
ncbi:Isoleucyl-tRNA synthetase [Tistlia consotensis]|uniref:Isoleucine--tRNA ligase n=1 Tax=Tistlia consotensis USBA 355 TaxID=560819 RepID=A0A1Y6BSC8_9PROT|nr:isoleucine--tRNA ligase [Tistlia consotensis]SMF18578.1 Isoleucyl-tRNA synthetase [Tistlia consotensis USBA 355]SNR39617.1 Isoleucyl-tRNA synthetase [Tistlia consotensis]